MVCVLMAAFPLSRTKKQFPHKGIFMWILVFCMLFNGGTVPWYITMKNYHLMDSIWGLVLGTGLQVFNVILAVNFFKNLPSELEEACYIDGGGPWRNLISICIPLAKPMVATIALFTMVMYWNEFFRGNGPEYKTKQLSTADLYPADGCNTGLFYNERRTDCTGDEIK